MSGVWNSSALRGWGSARDVARAQAEAEEEEEGVGGESARSARSANAGGAASGEGAGTQAHSRRHVSSSSSSSSSSSRWHERKTAPSALTVSTSGRAQPSMRACPARSGDNEDYHEWLLRHT